tara:strand:- start:273 stop:488 length:216 start_codon:yes stop_codon:yes gene_type:complete
MKKYKDLITELNKLTNNDFCCGYSPNLTIFININDMKLLDKEVTDPTKGHQIYGIPIEVGEDEMPTLRKNK